MVRGEKGGSFHSVWAGGARVHRSKLGRARTGGVGAAPATDGDPTTPARPFEDGAWRCLHGNAFVVRGPAFASSRGLAYNPGILRRGGPPWIASPTERLSCSGL